MAESLPVTAAALLLLAAGIGVVWWLLRRRAGAGTQRREGLAIESMHLREFEGVVAESFRRQGYLIVESNPPGAAASTDIILRRDRATYLVQCRHWKTAKVDVSAVQALQRAMAARGAAAGYLLTTGRFSREATAFAAGGNVKLIDGPALAGLLAKSHGAAKS